MVETTLSRITSSKLPKNWEQVIIGDILKLEYGKSLPSKDRVPGQYPVFGSGGQVGEHNAVITKDPAIVVGRKGSIGAVFFSESPCWAIDTTYYIDNFPPYILPKYIYYFLRIIGLETLNRSAAIPGLSRDDVHAFQIPIPFLDNPGYSLDIQRRIVVRIEALLAEVRSSRELLEKMRRNAKLVVNSALTQIFGKIRSGFDLVDVSPNQIKQIKDVASVERGKFSHRPINDPKFFGGSMPWIQIQNLPKDSNKYINDYMDTLNEQGVAISKIFPKGTLVLSIAATIGDLGILNFDACFPDSLVGITPYEDVLDPGFLYWQLLFIKEHLEAIAPAAAQKNVNLQILNKINLWIPSLNDQRIINHYIDSIQNEVNEMLKLMDQDAKTLDLLEQSILERAFRGEL